MSYAYNKRKKAIKKGLWPSGKRSERQRKALTAIKEARDEIFQKEIKSPR